MPVKKYKYDIVEVTWDDAAVENSWTSLPLKVNDQIVYTVGFLIEETEKHIVVSCTYSETDATGFIQIPKGMVLEMKTIRKKGKGP